MGNVKRVLIDRNTLIGKDGLFSKRGCPGNCQHCGLWTEDGCRVILEAQPVDAVEVVHGRWINPYINRYGHPCHCCSVCGFKASYQDKNYCPNCGADMRGDVNA